jgi:CCR4-NOT transcription complex subunit 7/8
MWNEDSIALLKKAGTDFDKHAAMGIDIQEFGSLLITSGLTFSDDVYWISFHSGYDFGYLTKLMWCRPLPNDEEKYRKLVKKFFPNLYDVKFMLRHAQKLRDRGTVTGQVATVLQSIGQKSSLQDIAEELGCTRVGIQHTAGSDAWLTGNVFWEMRKRVFDNQIPEELNGQMWGLTGVGPPASAAAHAAVLAAQNHAAAAANGMISNSQYHQPSSHNNREGGPSTPTTHPAGLASTPSQGYQGSNMTPGGGGVFGNFQYGK